MDVLYCKKKKRIKYLLAYVKEKRSEGSFQAIYAKAADLTSDPHAEALRKCCLSQLQDPKEHYRNLYMAIQDNLSEQIPRRFANLERRRFLELVNPGKFYVSLCYVSTGDIPECPEMLWPVFCFRETKI